VEAGGFGVSDWLKSIGGGLFFIAGLLKWWELQRGEGLSIAFTGFDYRYTGTVPYVIFVAIAILTIIVKTESLNLPRFVVDPVLTLVVAGVATALFIYRFFADGIDNEALDEGSTVTRGIGLYLALAGALMVLAGSVIAYRDHRAAGAEDEDEHTVDDTPTTIDRPSPPLP
jgi:hypothetical protein